MNWQVERVLLLQCKEDEIALKPGLRRNLSILYIVN